MSVRIIASCLPVLNGVLREALPGGHREVRGAEVATRAHRANNNAQIDIAAIYNAQIDAVAP